MRLLLWPILLLFCGYVGAADTITLTAGGKLEGTILQQNERTVVINDGIGTITLPRTRIALIEHRDDPPAPAPTIVVTDVLDDRLPSWEVVVMALAKQAWATDLRQIPATVIDVGVMKRVPYSSYRCGAGGQIEVNVYGDPLTPICLELGVYGPKSSDPAIRRQLVEFAEQRFVRGKLNKAIVAGLDRNQDTATHKDLTMEITPPSAPDAYGAWWIAVYFQDKVEKARATPVEIEAISVTRASAAASTSDEPGTWGAEDIRRSRDAPVAAFVPTPGVTSGGSTWTSSGGSSSGGGRVYVRGYTRKDGTYVRSHTRKR